MAVALKTLLISLLVLTVSHEALAKKKKSRKRAAPAAPVSIPAPEFKKTEVKTLIAESSIPVFLDWIRDNKSDYEQKQSFIIDTKNMDLNRAGVLLKLQRLSDDTYNALVEVQSDIITEIPKLKKARKDTFECQTEALTHNKSVQACLFLKNDKKILGSIESAEATKNFSSEQLKFAKWKYAELNTKELTITKKIMTNVWSFEWDSIPFVCELWTLHNAKRYLSCSTVGPKETQEASTTKLLEFLKKANLNEANKDAPVDLSFSPVLLKDAF